MSYTCACRYNKYVKNLVRDVSHPEAHLANSSTQDMASLYINLADSPEYDVDAELLHKCVLSLPTNSECVLSRKELADLRQLGCRVDMFSAVEFKIAIVMGVHFRAGEWLRRPRCGSVITCVLRPTLTSRYARVDKFVRVDGDSSPGYAIVTWFSAPTYPNGTPLVVTVTDNGSDVDDELGCVVPITQIDPSRVMVEVTQVQNTFKMMRDSGYDTM